MEQNFQSNESVRDYVLQDERLLWTGKPVKPIKLLPGEKFNIVFGVFWIVFSIFWMGLAFATVKKFDEQDILMMKIFPYFGIPFSFVGLYLVFLSPFRIMNKRKYIEYALTNKRILIFNNGKKKTLNTFKYSDIHNISFGCDENGVGAVTFFIKKTGATTFVDGHPSRSAMRTMAGMYNIENVKKVYKIFCYQTGEKEQ
ncbi:MAG: hypothetical protein E7622_01390 [Ruminococcaceae bacterium]|nr:hypothetical protein [Oscillospiraceae bacterium]